MFERYNDYLPPIQKANTLIGLLSAWKVPAEPTTDEEIACHARAQAIAFHLPFYGEMARAVEALDKLLDVYQADYEGPDTDAVICGDTLVECIGCPERARLVAHMSFCRRKGLKDWQAQTRGDRVPPERIRAALGPKTGD